MGGSIVKATFFKRARRLRRGFIRASIYAGPGGLPQCFRQLRIIVYLWQAGEPCKLLKTLNIYGLKGHCSLAAGKVASTLLYGALGTRIMLR